ncbi:MULTISPECIES: hypothetical protein [Pseudomonas]|uniref:hypothetical protein n=1 Tax=Pseudomonas TaxID=286 RepID=UPI000C88A8F6|nr:MULTISPECIES: hypothetical protein [Pseudomonas]PNA00058.1 hypothetical protein C1X79_06695 [Pseudomonas sp. FW305-42]PNA24283.1 hypothetical protein C1X78_11705 [Pseudomonas sp. MPR-R1B]PNB24925.1 hypothetical protein C1X80_15755 [Pseudomonas sp. DP16D-E2]PNB42987.1 hypothetical protein C1X75_13180 [Pseudomonas sp. FW305-17]PNB63355.1 hypothetical protein C1X77_07005 [Pseudomonas sp. GW531-E2]
MGKHQHLVDLALGGELPKLAIEFFIVFSRFECALKRSADYAAPGGNVKVHANWDAFASDLGTGFFEEVLAQGLAPELVHRPPKLQVLLPHGGGLGWRDTAAVTNSVELFLAIRRARNNLVHGAKYRDQATGQVDLIEGSERDERLLDQALAVLGLALERHAEIQRYFQPY